MKEIFSDWLTRGAGLVLVLSAVTVLFNIYSHLPEEYPLFGVFSYGLVPILFVAGGVIFVLAILNFARGGADDR